MLGEVRELSMTERVGETLGDRAHEGWLHKYSVNRKTQQVGFITEDPSTAPHSACGQWVSHKNKWE